MSVPFQCLSPLGQSSLFCAAKGCIIQTFDLAGNSQPLFSWTHPSLRQTEVTDPEAKATHERNDGDEEEQTGQPPPSKRQKLESKGVELNSGPENGHSATLAAPASSEKDQKKGKGKWTQPKPEAPFVILLTATGDGSHVVAVTGQDKTLWVFEHDGKGSLEQVSQRSMPKRPCSLALTADGQTILSADKFGDVYALPLIPYLEEGTEPTHASDSPVPAPLRGANVFTVHSQRNRRALEDQQRQRESNTKRDLPKEGPKFAHEVLLGHVSMLTCVLTAHDSRGRSYIITADRDEHIRVSRGIPQSHVIVTFCLGHGAFVNALCNPTLRPDILISGGGDDELFIWDWLAGKLLGTVDLMAHVRDVLPDVNKIAVAKLAAYQAGNESYVVAICEWVPALFIFQLWADNTLLHKETIPLRGNALDMTTSGTADQVRLIAAIDMADGHGEVLVFEHGEQHLIPGEPIHGTADGQPVFRREDIERSIYTVENLRKTGMDEDINEAPPETSEQIVEIQHNID